MTVLELVPFSISTRRKLVSILLAIAIFASLGGLTTLAVGRPIAFGIIDAILVGLGVGLFEEFYVQTLRGRWLRRMHPLGSIGVYTLFVVAIFLVAIHLSHLMLGRLDDLPIAYARLPFARQCQSNFRALAAMVALAKWKGGSDSLKFEHENCTGEVTESPPPLHRKEAEEEVQGRR